MPFRVSRNTLFFPLFSLLALGSLFVVAPPTQAATSAVSPASLTLTIDDQTKTVSKETLQSWYSPQFKTVFDFSHRNEILKSSWCPVWKTFLCQLSRTRTEQQYLRITSTVQLNDSRIQDFLQQLAPQIAKPLVEPRFTIQDGKVTEFAQGQTGKVLDTEASLAVIKQRLAAGNGNPGATPLALATKTLSPEATGTPENTLGITELIGEGRTNFAGSPKNRIHNFTLAAQQFNGLIIKPGEEFSFVEHLGPVDGEHGYLPELVIKQNETTPEFGGGICQVSSTAFRAALNSGLKITARRNHAYPVQYYKPYGMDATVYIPKPDLKFVNNTPASILIQTAVEGQELVFRFYGTNDGRKTSIDGPHILEHNPDGSMKTVFTQTVVDKNGSTLINDSFNSNYKSPSLFPHPGQDPVFTSKPADWSQKQWSDYKKSHG